MQAAWALSSSSTLDCAMDAVADLRWALHVACEEPEALSSTRTTTCKQRQLSRIQRFILMMYSRNCGTDQGRRGGSGSVGCFNVAPPLSLSLPL